MDAADGENELYSRLVESLQKNSKRIKEVCSELSTTWSELWDETVRTKRLDVLCEKFEEEIFEFLEEVTNKEKLTKDDYIERIENLLSEINELQTTLQIAIPYEDVENLPLHEMAFHLNKKAEKYRAIKTERINKQVELIRREALLCEKLDTKPTDLKFSQIPTKNELKQFENHIAAMEQEIKNRTLMLKESSQKIDALYRELDMKPTLNFEKEVLCSENHDNFVLSNENMKALSDLLARMEQQVEDAKQTAEELVSKLNMIWDYLDEDVEYRKRFLEAHVGYRITVITALEEEVQRCEQLKKNNVSKIVAKMRQVLTEQWDKCLISKDEREQFRPFNSDCFTQDLLELHEFEIDRMKNYYKENEEIFTLIPKHEKLFKKLIELENTSKNANRYYNRGGQLLQEERMRKQITKELPVVEEQLRNALVKYEEKNGKQFTSYGVPMLFLLDEQWTTHFDQKTIDKLTRKMGSEKMKTPLGKRTLHTPASLPATKVSRLNVDKVSTTSTVKSSKVTSSAKRVGAATTGRKCFVDDDQQVLPDTTCTIDTYDEFQSNLQAKVDSARKDSRQNLRSTLLREATTPLRPVLREQNTNNTPKLLRSATVIKTTPSKCNFSPMYSPPRRKTPKTTPRLNKPQSGQKARLTPALNRLPFFI